MLPASVGRPQTDAARAKSPAVQDRTIGSDIDAHAQRVDPRQPLIEQAAYRRIAGCGRILGDASAVDDGVNLKALNPELAAAAITNGRPAEFGEMSMILAAIKINRWSADCLRYRELDLGGHAVPMDIPPGAGVFEEAPSGSRSKPAPETLRERPQSATWRRWVRMAVTQQRQHIVGR